MNVFKLFGTIAVNNTDANSSIDDTNSRATRLAATFKSAFSTVGNIALTCGKAIAVGLGAGATAMGALMKSSITSYAEYEQLVGGVETLFKDSSGKVQQYAANAYKTAGMSANDYMSTVTSFSASLLQSMKGDTAAAADIANMALSDMADNANKMGTSMSSIQDAYQGFAKQNYTMLDNLKLGYGGTKTEMQRLLKDAQKITGVKYNIKNLDDVYEAIHVIQTEMGITGTTALEASETISGSFASASAAWQNLLVGIADGNQDMGYLMNNFIAAGKTAVRNVTKLLPSLVQGVQGLIQGLSPDIPGIIQAIFPAVLDGAIALIGGLAQSLPGLISALGSTIATVWGETVWPAIQDFFKINFDVTLPDWAVITDSVEQELAPIVNNMNSAISNMQTFFTDMNTVLVATSDWCTTNSGIVTAFFGSLATALLAACAPLALIGTIAFLVAINWDALKNVVNAVSSAIDTFFNKTIPEWWQSKVVDPIIAAWEGVQTWINNAATAIGNFFSVSVPAGFSSFISSITEGWNSIISTISSAIEKLKEFLGLSNSGNTPATTSEASAAGWSGEQINTGLASGAIKPDGSHASGLDYVPRDNYIANLHKGEAVLTRVEADVWRSGGHSQETAAAVYRLAEALPDMLVNAFSAMRFDVNNREFARMVKAVT